MLYTDVPPIICLLAFWLGSTGMVAYFAYRAGRASKENTQLQERLAMLEAKVEGHDTDLDELATDLVTVAGWVEGHARHLEQLKKPKQIHLPVEWVDGVEGLDLL
jgi:hypothetical protein